MRVLLAEDNAIARTALAGRLRGQGYEVELAEDGEEALGQVRQNPPDIVIADVLMPRMDGYSLCRAIKEDPALNSIPVVFYSATFITSEDRQLAESVGASRFLQKSADVTELSTALHEVLDEFEHERLEVPQLSLKSGQEIDKFYESIFTSKLAAKVNELESEKRALRESERRYRNLFEMMEDGMAVHELVYDAQGKPADYRFLEVNPAFERLTGLSADNVVGRTVREALPGTEQQWIDDYISIVQSGEPKRFLRYAAELDRYYDVVAFRNADNQFVALFSDVTEHHKNEETIRNLARFPEENPSPVLRLANNGVLLYANQASELMKGQWNLEQGKPVPDELLAEIHTAQQGDNRFTCALGERWFSFLIRPFSEAGYVNIYGREVTAEYNAQQELVSLNRVLQTLSEGTRTLVHAQSEHALLENICRVFTQEGDYPAAWISVPSRDGSALECLACDGELKDFLLQWGWQEVAFAQQTHPMVMAFTTRENVIINTSDDSAAFHRLDGEMAAINIGTIFLLPIRYQNQVFGLIGIFSRLPFEMQAKELSLLDELASDLGYGVQSHRTKLAHEGSVQRLNRAMMHTIEAVSIALEKRDPYTAGHQNRVASLSMAIAREMGFSDERIEGIRLGSMVHDIGKISVPAEILNRPGRLSKDEFGIIKAHPESGYDILKGVDFPWPIAQMILQHHERVDGSGYPQGLKGNEITPEARILAVADVVEAITSHRPYRPSLGIDIALNEIERGRGTYYDAEVVDACLRLFREKGFAWEGL